VIENLEFQNARRATLRISAENLSAGGLASPLLTFAMEGEPLDLRAAWANPRSGSTRAIPPPPPSPCAWRATRARC
jgi:hypothetical protein